MKFDEFSQDEIKKVGAELAEAREVLNKTSLDFVLDLRTTKHHINAIEDGELRIFYGPPFYLDLLRRYALALNLSEPRVKQLEQRITKQQDKSDEQISVPEEKNGDDNVKDRNVIRGIVPTHKHQKDRLRIVLTSSPINYSQVRMSAQEKNKLFERNRVLLRYIYGIVLFTLSAVYFLDVKKTRIAESVAQKSNFATTIRPGKVEVAIDPLPTEKDVERIQNLSPDDQLEIGNLKGQDIDLQNEQWDSKGIKPFIVLKEINLEFLDSETKSPKVVFDVRRKTWLWIKFADESVDEFVVQENEKVLIENYPIYVVVGDPDNVFVWIGGERYNLEANDPDRNIARLTRSQLLQFNN